MKQFIAQKAVVLHNDQVLLIHYLESKFAQPDVKLENKWAMPGGKIEVGISANQSLIDEVFEETGVTVEPLEPFYIFDWTYKKLEDEVQIVAVVRYARYVSGELISFKEEKETKIDKVQWWPLADLDKLAIVLDEKPALDIARKAYARM